MTARRVAVRTDQEERPPRETQNCRALIGALQLHMAPGVVGYTALQPYRLFDLAVALIFPDQQIGDSARIVEIASHKPSGDHRHVLAVEPRPETEEMAVPSAPLFSLLHRLIPLIILSSKILVTGAFVKKASRSARLNLRRPPMICLSISPRWTYSRIRVR